MDKVAVSGTADASSILAGSTKMEKQKAKKINFKREFSAGCVVYKKLSSSNSKDKIKFLLGKHSGYHKWVLPKGLIEKGEKGVQTALRETEEEMGVKAKLVADKPIHKEQYFFYADYKPQKAVANKAQNPKVGKNSKETRRVMVYQEEGGSKIKVFKIVTFYLVEYLSGSPKEHGWEMEKAGWFAYQKAFKLLAFKGEREALKKAWEIIKTNLKV